MGLYSLSEGDKAKGADQKSGAKGMIESRSTTDILFLILIIAMWVAMSGVGGDAVNKGNIYRLIGPINDQGKICGIDSGFSHLSRLYYVTTSGMGVCMHHCPDTAALATSTDPSDYYCLNAQETNFVAAAASGSSYAVAKTLYIQNYCWSSGSYDASLTSSTCLCNLRQKTKSVFRRCVFTDSAVMSKYVNQDAADYFKVYIPVSYTHLTLPTSDLV